MRKPICGLGMASSLVSILMAMVGAAAPAGAGAGGACPAGMEIEYSYQENFETGAPGWTHSAVVGPDTWVLQSSNPSPGSGGFNFHADDWSSPSDQRLVSPAIDLPSGANQLTMQFLNDQAFEDPAGSGGCWDGGTLEVSTNGGSTWVPLDAELLTDPYDGIGDNGPPAGRNMWCGETNGIQPWLNSIVDMSAYDGQTVLFRFSMLTDAAAGAPGWAIDDVVIASCVPVPSILEIPTLSVGGLIALTLAMAFVALALVRRKRVA